MPKQATKLPVGMTVDDPACHPECSRSGSRAGLCGSFAGPDARSQAPTYQLFS